MLKEILIQRDNQLLVDMEKFFIKLKKAMKEWAAQLLFHLKEVNHQILHSKTILQINSILEVQILIFKNFKIVGQLI